MTRLRVGLLLDSIRTIALHEALICELLDRGCSVHLAVQGESLRDRDGAIGRLAARSSELAIGQAPSRTDRWAPVLSDIQSGLEATPETDLDAAAAAEPPSRRKSDLSLLRAIPPSPEVEAYLAQLDLDLMLLTTRREAGIGRLDMWLACRRAGVRTAVLAGAEEAELVSGALGAAETPAIALGSDELDPGVRQDVEQILAWARRPAPTTSVPLSLRIRGEIAFLHHAVRRVLEDRTGDDLGRGILAGLLAHAAGWPPRAYARWLFPPLLGALLALLPKRRAMLREVLSAQLNPSEFIRLTWVEDEIDRVRRGAGIIIFGPWTGGVGHELLYWIPFLRWFRKYYRIDRSRIVVISRGGVGAWYSRILGRYFDVFDLAPLKRQEYRDEALKNAVANVHVEQSAKIDSEIYRAAARAMGVERYQALHPQVMFKLFRRRWNKLAGENFLHQYTRVEPVNIDLRPAAKRLGALPPRYVAAAFHAGDELPDTLESRALVEGLVRTLARKVDVMLIEPADDPTASLTSDIPTAGRVRRLDGQVRPNEFLAVQSAVIAGAEALVGTFGGMTFVGQAQGVRSIGFRSRRVKPSSGVEELTAIRPDPDGGRIDVVDIEDAEALVPWLETLFAAGDDAKDRPARAEVSA